LPQLPTGFSIQQVSLSLLSNVPVLFQAEMLESRSSWTADMQGKATSAAFEGLVVKQLNTRQQMYAARRIKALNQEQRIKNSGSSGRPVALNGYAPRTTLRICLTGNKG
jgi:hypothetical protein